METERLRLERVKPDDWEAMSAWTTDKRVYKYLPSPVCKTPEEPKAWLPKKDPNDKDHILMLVTCKDDGHAVGLYALNHDLRRDVWTLSYVNRYDDWGKGYTVEGMTALMDYARNELGATKFEGECATHNLGSALVMEKLGMKCTRYSKFWKEDAGKWFFSYVYTI